MTRRKALVLASVVAAAALFSIAWIASHRGPPATPSMRIKSEVVDDATAVQRSPATVAAKPDKSRALSPTHALPDWNVPLEEAIPLLLKAAESGDTTAQMELSTRLSGCTEHALHAADASDESDRDTIEEDKTNENLDDRLRATRAINGQYRIDQHAEAKRACSRLPADVRAHWLNWIDQAAHAGNTAAMLEYAKMSVAEYDSVGAIVANVDTAIERRDKARAYLLEALQLGEQQSLRELAYGYFERSDNIPRVFGVDPLQSYAYAYAGTLAGVSNRGDLDWVMSKNAESLDARQLAEAQALGHGIYERCCDKH